MNTVDVIVPCYNYGRFLKQCVGSVLSQADCEVRVLIIDDASPDGSAAVARDIAHADSRVELILHAENKGHIATYNEGIAWLRSDYMLLLSADDVLAPGGLARAVRLMTANPAVAFVYGRAIRFVDGQDLPEPDVPGLPRVRPGRDFVHDICATPVNPVETATAVVRTSVQQRIGGYLPALPHAGDFEMWLRCAAHGDVGVVDAVQAFVRMHGKNMRDGYLANRMLGDFTQRYAALRMFFTAQGGRLRDAAELEQFAYRRLAEHVTWAAAYAFEANAPDAVEQLADLAKKICPDIVHGSVWWRLSIKRLIGVRGWQRVAPAMARISRLTAHRSLPQDASSA
jgi:glycosyltransferase involved in cell wall biosynthesis